MVTDCSRIRGCVCGKWPLRCSYVVCLHFTTLSAYRAGFRTCTHSGDDDTTGNVIHCSRGVSGVGMTPISSVLEAANAGHANPMPMYTRWSCGIVARTGREIIFAAGLNQMSDYLEERVPESITNGLIRNNLASLSSGILAGYFSHVPHNLSTLKLMNPKKSYKDHFLDYAKGHENKLPNEWPTEKKQKLARVYALVAPRAMLVRTTQIVGTFILLNGGIYMMRDFSPF
eukprot:m.606674 g.606674  ORF g.606674 m.606674 type:complete len:229 (+) comp22473_c1_seq6:118-804(+)